MTRRKEQPKRDLKTALTIAQEYLRQMEIQFSEIVKNSKHDLGKPPPPDYLTKNRGLLPFYATNLLFCTELYLKLLLSASGEDVPNSHNLWIIFRKFSPSNADAIERAYESEFDRLEIRLSLIGQVSLPSSGESEKFRAEHGARVGGKQRSEHTELKQVLKKTSDSYLFWRYFAEALTDKRAMKSFEFHYCYLHALCRACDAIAREASVGRVSNPPSHGLPMVR